MRLRDFLMEDNWCQGAYAKDARGNECLSSSEDATSFCLLGAMQICYPDGVERHSIELKYASLVRIITGDKVRVKDYNDSADWNQIERLLNTVDA